MPEYKNVVVFDGTITICFYMVNFIVYVFFLPFSLLTHVVRTREEMQVTVFY